MGHVRALGKLLESMDERSMALDSTRRRSTRLLDEVIAAGQNLDGINQDDVPLPPDAAVTQMGDLWMLGRSPAALRRQLESG